MTNMTIEDFEAIVKAAADEYIITANAAIKKLNDKLENLGNDERTKSLPPHLVVAAINYQMKRLETELITE